MCLVPDGWKVIVVIQPSLYSLIEFVRFDYFFEDLRDSFKESIRIRSKLVLAIL